MHYQEGQVVEGVVKNITEYGVFVDLGVSKLRITGGEPLTRSNMMLVFRQLGALKHLAMAPLTVAQR